MIQTIKPYLSAASVKKFKEEVEYFDQVYSADCETEEPWYKVQYILQISTRVKGDRRARLVDRIREVADYWGLRLGYYEWVETQRLRLKINLVQK